MVLLKSTRQDLWPRVIHKRKEKIFFDTYSPVAWIATIRVPRKKNIWSSQMALLSLERRTKCAD